MTAVTTAAQNALTLLKQFTTLQGADDKRHFDSVGFIAEMEARAAADGRKLTQSELRSLGKMARVYCQQYNVVRS